MEIYPIPVACHHPISTSFPHLQVFVFSSVSILVMGCVSYTAMIMCSSLQDGRSSLMIASQNGHNAVVRMLLSAGAKVDLQDEVSILRPYGNLCPDVMLYLGLEGYVHTIVFVMLRGVNSCVGL